MPCCCGPSAWTTINFFVYICIVINALYNQGRIQDLVRGGAKLTQWRRMRHLSSRTRMNGSTLLHKFFVTLPIFPSEEQKKQTNKKKKVSTYCYSHYGPSPNLLVTTQASMRPSSTVAVSIRLSKLTEEHDLPVPAKLWTGVL